MHRSHTHNLRSPADNRHATPAVLDSQTLFAQHREVLIRHHGKDYRLQLTRSNKLILVK